VVVPPIVIVAVFDVPYTVAVIVTGTLLAATAVAVNVAEECPAWIVTESEVRIDALDLYSAMLVFRRTAELVCTMQFAEAPTARLEGAQERDCKVVGGNTVKVVLTLVDPVVAVMTTACG
jgi:hypothetical protein